MNKIGQKRIKMFHLVIGILVMIIALLIFFGWYYFMAKRNPVEQVWVDNSAPYKYLYSIYDPKVFQRPMGVAADSDSIYVTDSAKHDVVVYDYNGKFLRVIGTPGSAPGQFNYPTGVAAFKNKIFVADFYNQRVQVLNPEGKVLNILPLERDKAKVGPVIMPATLTVDKQGQLYVSDINTQQILVFDHTGNYLRSFGVAGAGAGELSYANGLAVDDEEGLVYISNSNNSRVDVFDLQGKFKTTLTKSVSVSNPKGIAFDAKTSRVYVADTLGHQIQGLEKDGRLYETIGARGIDNGQFNFPNGVFIDAMGRLYVADRENNRVQVFEREAN